MAQKIIREIVYYKEYYLEFFAGLLLEVQEKFNWTLQLIATTDRVPIRYFKYVENTDGLFEIRVEVGNNIFRVFSFFDKGQLLIITNGFQKKSQKTPRKEIKKANRIQKEYFDEKRKQ